MTPADQRFGADQAAVGQMQLRLIEQFELAALRRQRQFGFQREAGFKLAADLVFEQHMTAAPGGFGAAQRHMGIAQEFVRATAAAGEDGGADADPDAMLAIAGQQRCVEAGADLVGETADVFADIAGPNRDGEFVAAQSRDHAGSRNRRRQPFRDRAQHEIAAGVAQHVVDLLEAIEADNQYRHLALVSLGA